MIPHKSSDFEAIDLVDAWEEVFLEDLIEDAIGGAWGDDPSKATEDQVIVRVIRGTEFRHWEKEKGATAATRAIDAKSFARRMLVPGDMVVEISGGGPSQPVGRTLVVDQEALDELGGKAISSNSCRRVRFKSHINPFYVDQALKLKYSLGELDQFQTETTNIRNLTFPKFISETSIPLPQREVQDQLVMIIKGLQAQIGQARDRLATIPALLKKFRQAVLAAACSGQLTADWHESHEADKWEDLMLAELIKGKPKNGYSAKPVGFPTKWKVLTLTATTSGAFDPTQYKYFEEVIPEDSEFWVRDGDIYFQRGNTIEYVGTPALYRGPDREFIYPDLMMRVKANEKVLPEFLVLACSNEPARQYLRDNATGSQGSMPKINQPTLMSLPLSIPGLEEQAEIVRRVESLFALADSIESRLAEATAKVERTTQAILAKAFRGEL